MYLNQDSYRKLISGQSTGAATVLRLCLQAVSWVYAVIIDIRNFMYDKGWLKVHRTDAVIISVGNITTGGTGKTPLVIWLCSEITKLKTKNCRIAILTRGYKATQNSSPKTQDYSDEPEVFIQSCPEAIVIVNPNRVEGARESISKNGVNVLIMDDGFQHRRLHRDLDIVTIDATCPFGYGKMLPAGLLREPMSALRRANAAVVTRCDQISEILLRELEAHLRQINPNMAIARAIHAPVCVKLADSKKIGIAELKKKKVFAFCGIGNPDAFFNTIRKIGANLAGSKIYNDHHEYTADDINDICQQAKVSKAELILTTQKDWTKVISDFIFQISDLKSAPLAYLEIELKFITPEERITGLIKSALSAKIPSKS